MDLIAYNNTQLEKVNNYIKKYYGEIPRYRGVRFMKLENKSNNKPNIDVCDILGTSENEKYDYTELTNMFNKYVGKDVIYIHTRCGDCKLGYDDKDSNYISCGGKDWEEKHKDLFLEHITDAFDSTYCTHYFKAVIDEDYKEFVGDK